jgi:hypothetical protein
VTLFQENFQIVIDGGTAASAAPLSSGGGDAAADGVRRGWSQRIEPMRTTVYRYFHCRVGHMSHHVTCHLVEP